MVSCIPIKLLANLANKPLCIWCSLFNRQIPEDLFPECLKLFLEISIHTNFDTSDMTNCRSTYYFSSAVPLSDYSTFCFQNKHVNTVIFVFLNKIWCSINTQERTAAVFCDLMETCDCVNHEILLPKAYDPINIYHRKYMPYTILLYTVFLSSGNRKLFYKYIILCILQTPTMYTLNHFYCFVIHKI